MVATLRLFRSRPGFVAVIVVTLGLGVGAPVTVFSVVHAVLLRPLPYPEAERLVQFRVEANNPAGTVAFDALPASAALQWGADSTALTGLALYNDRALTLTTAAGSERLAGIAATPNFLQVVGVAPAVGEGFDSGSRDDRHILLSDATWRRHFGASASIVGTSVLLDGESYLVRGVMPPEFAFPSDEAAFWVPMPLDAGGSRGMLLPAVARMRAGATVPEVAEEGQRHLTAEGPPRERRTLLVRTVHEQLVGPVERVIWVVLAAVALVSAIAAANIALLLLARGAGRAQELRSVSPSGPPAASCCVNSRAKRWRSRVLAAPSAWQWHSRCSASSFEPPRRACRGCTTSASTGRCCSLLRESRADHRCVRRVVGGPYRGGRHRAFARERRAGGPAAGVARRAGACNGSPQWNWR